MKKIEAIIRPQKLDDVRESLKNLGYPGMSITRIEGHGRQKGKIEQFRGQEYKVELLAKVKIEIITKDSSVIPITKAIAKAAMTGDIGDGKIFISPVEETIRIRTGEKGEETL